MGVALAVCKKEGLIIMFWGAPISGFVNILVYLNKQANNFEKSLQFFFKLKILEISIIRSLISLKAILKGYNWLIFYRKFPVYKWDPLIILGIVSKFHNLVDNNSWHFCIF